MGTDAPSPSPLLFSRAGAHRLVCRPISGNDRALLRDIYASTRIEEVAQTGWPEAQQQAFLTMQFEAQHKHYQVHYPAASWLIIECKTDGADMPVGRLYVVNWTSELRIIDIALLPMFRGRGWGEAILRDLKADATSHGRKVSIHVEKSNRARQLYGRLGFSVVEDKGVYDLMEWSPFDQVKTAS